MKIIQSLNIIHQEGGMAFETMNYRHQQDTLILFSPFQLLDKNCQSSSMGKVRTKDCIDMHRIAFDCIERNC
jgi:trimethylamine:corrinoid methyltransferase-like protein